MNRITLFIYRLAGNSVAGRAIIQHLVLLCKISFAVSFALVPSKIQAQSFPPGFSQVAIGNIYYPTSMAFAPDGRIFCTEKAGKVKIVKNGTVLSTPFVTVTVDQLNERGLSSVSLDPNFNSNHYVYIYYTSTSGTIHNRLSRFIANGDVAVAGSEVVLLEIQPAVNSIHNAGAMIWAPDGTLYLSVGDDEPDSPINYTSPNAQDLTNYKGKVLHLNADGTPAAGNPLSGSDVKARIWAYGLRNPWSMSMQPGTNRLFVNDVGQDGWEEVNDATAGGENFGWPFAEGPSNNPAYTNPVYAYPHGPNDSIGCAITGGAFFNPPSTNYPVQYIGKYFIIDYCSQRISYIDPNNPVKIDFATGVGGANNRIQVGNDGNLYYYSISQNLLYKIIYTSSNNPPVITQQPTNKSVTAGQSVTFSVAASGTSPLGFQWRKNGVSITGANSFSFTINNVQASDSGLYSVKVSNNFGSATSNSAKLTILKTSNLNLASQPSGLQLLLDGQSHTTPYSALEISGTNHVLGSASPQLLDTTYYAFDYWLQGGPATQTVSTTDQDTTFTAVFKVVPKPNCSATGIIVQEVWSNISGYSISSIPVNTAPTFTRQLNIFEEPSNAGDNYGSRIRAYLCVPITGNYTFWIASDDNSELWLSADSTPTSKTKIAYVTGYTGSRQWTKYPSQQSAPVFLSAGRKYYIESLHKEGTQGDNLAVGWQLPNGTMERPIPGTRLSAYTTTSNSTPTVSITSPANNASFPSPVNIAISANALSNGGTITKVEFYQGSTLIGQATAAPYNFTWQNVTTGTYTLTAKAYDNNLHTAVSSPVTIVVTTCPTPIIYASGPTTFCSGSVKLSTTSGAGYVFQWKKDGVNIPGATASSYIATVAGAYQVKVIQGSCIAWSAPTNVKIESGLRASITPGGSTTICSGSSVILYGNTCPGYSYQWIRNGTNIAGATGSTYPASVAGNYQLKVTLNGANAWSSIVTVTVNTCNARSEEEVQQETTSIKTDTSGLFQMKVYPNPNDGRFTISLRMAAETKEKAIVKMLNSLGQVIYNSEYTAENGFISQTVDLDKSLPTGIYVLQVTVGDKQESTNVMLAR
jgi:glucose/arabinose dehydrogenase